MFKEIDSIVEILFFVSNIGIILIGIYFLISAKTIIAKILSASPAIITYLLTPAAIILACHYEWADQTFCREAGFIYLIFPNYIFGFTIFQLLAYKVWFQHRT
jgi:uncharacterized membrane protein